MSGQCLTDHLTPLTPQSVYASLRAAAPSALGCELDRPALLVLLAHIDEETGWKACHAFNLGNVKHIDGDGHDYVKFTADEMVDGRRVVSEMQFRAYASLDEACADYLVLLKRHFDKAWVAVLAGDPAQFAHLLKTEHYYTADEARYTANVVALDKQLGRLIPEDDPAPPTDPAPFTDPVQVAAVDGQPTPPEDLVLDALPPRPKGSA